MGLEVAFLYGPGTLKKKHVSIRKPKNQKWPELGELSY